MNRVKAFFYIYKNSLTSIGYYKDVVNHKLSFSLKYFLSLAVISALIVTVSVTLKTYPQINSTMEDMLSKIKEAYPQDLVITTNDTVWSINLPEPLVIPFPDVESLQEAAEIDAQSPNPQGIPENLIVLDHNGTVEDFEKMNTLILVNEKNILVKEANNYSVYPIEKLPNTQINQASFMSMVDGLRAFTKYLPLIIAVLMFLGVIFYYLVFRMIYLMIVAFMTWLVTFVFGSKLNYKQNLQVCTHALTLPLTVEVIISALGLNLEIPFWFALTNILFAVVVIYKLAKDNNIKAVPATLTPEEPQEPTEPIPPSNLA